MKSHKQMKERRGELVKSADMIIRGASVEKRDIFPSEDHRLEEIKTEIFQLDCDIAKEQRQIEREVQGSGGAGSGTGGMDLAGYSLGRAIRCAGEGKIDGLEAEASQEIARRSGRPTGGLYIPNEVLIERRAGMSVTGDSGANGGSFVQTEVRGFIDALRPYLAVGRAGATILDGLGSNIAIPRQSAASTASWKPEIAELDERSPAFDQLELTPHRVGAFVTLSNQLLIQSDLSVESLIRNDLLSACAISLDKAALNGSGTGGEPKGILSTAGIGSVVGGTNGAVPDWQDMVNLVAAIENENAFGEKLAFITNSAVAAMLRATPKVASTDSRMVLESNRLLDFPIYFSGNVPSNLTKGTAAGICSAILFGDWSQVVLAGFGTGMEIIVDRFSKATSGQTRVICNSFVDVGIKRPESFAAMKDALTA